MYQPPIKTVLIPVMKTWVGYLVIIFGGCCIPYGESCAKNLKLQGSVYEIKEQDALEWITGRLREMQNTGEIEMHNQRLKKRALGSIERPHPVLGLRPTTVARTFEKDLSIVVSKDMVDDQGNIIHKAGTRINPLKGVFKQKRVLIFIDGEDEKQLQWALAQYNSDYGLVKLVLVNGSPLHLMQQYEIPFYFDQEGRLSRNFTLEQIPAKVSEEPGKLLISEVKL